MLGTSVVKQYFSSGTEHKVIPSVSAEWNYNLFYAPYATFAGNGNEISTSWTNPSSWSTTNCTATYDTSLGRSATAYNDKSAIKFTTTGQQGSAVITLYPAGGASTTNAYKITFYAKTVENVEVNLSALTYLDSHRSSSSSQTIDDTVWTKFEVYMTSLPTENAYSSFTLTLDFTSRDTTMASQVQSAPSTYNVLIDQFTIYQTTEFDYQYGTTWPTASPFYIFRPGESYVPSGNALTPLPSNFRQIKTQFNNSGYNWNNQFMPCSPVTFHPHILGSANSNPVFKNGIVSDYTTYKYFVSDGNTNSIGAFYDTLLASNKIVLKFNIQYFTPTSMTINLYNTSTNYSYSLNITNSDISSAGVCIIYLQPNGSWVTANNGGAWTTMPTFNNTTGAITLSQNINKIVVTQNSASINPAYSNPASDITSNTMNGVSYPGRYSQYQADMTRLQVIEISPRIELDLSGFLVDVDTKVELDNKQSPLPISAISANNATIHLTTIPLSVSNSPLSIFSNNSSSSPLAGLFKQNVKIIINYIVKDNLSSISSQYSLTSPTSTDYVVSGGVYYSDTWTAQDLEVIEVVAYDITKYLQLISPTDYVSQSQDVFKIISNILDFAGFTDYDYDSLRKVTLSQNTLVDGTVLTNKQPMESSFYYTDGLQQKVFDVLRELFEVYQIGAYINSYGVMEFLSLDNILGNTTPSLLVHNGSTPVAITAPTYTDNLTVTSNITEDTYVETIKSKIGKATLKYKIPQINKTFDIQGLANTQNLSTTLIDKNDILWQPDKDSAVPFNFLNQSISTYSQNYFYLNPQDLLSPFTQFPLDQDGYAIIEGEIVTFSDKEFNFSITNSSGVTSNYTAIIGNQSDLQTAVSDFSARAGLSGNVTYTPTGKIANIQRGMFNTPVRTHNVISNTNASTDPNSVYSRMQVYSGLNPAVVDNKILMQASQIGVKSILVPLDDTSSSQTLSLNDGSSTGSTSLAYNTFSCKMGIGPLSGTNFQDGVGGGLVFNLGGNPVYVEIRFDMTNSTTIVNKKKVTVKVPQYRLYVYNSSGTLLGPDKAPQPYYVINQTLLNDSAAYPEDSPFAEFAKTVHLKFVALPSRNNFNKSFKIYLNKEELAIQTKTITLDTTGQYGIFTHTTNQSSGTTGSIPFTELYATQTALSDAGIWYHWEMPSFANTLASKQKVFELNYMMQTRPEVIGISYFDVQYQLAPAINAYPVPSPYSWYYYTSPTGSTTTITNTSSGTVEVLENINVQENSLSYSNIYNSGFRGRMAIINSSPSSIWIKKTADQVNPIEVNFLVNTNNLVTLSSEISIEKIFDPANISQSIEITSNWVQSDNAALGILKNIFRANDGFSRDTEISIYGNPLLEIGDVVNVNYSLKNIVNKKYFVQGIEQNFTQGLLTTLTLNELPTS